MDSLAEVVAAAKDGLADFLSTTEGLRATDGVKVWSAWIDPTTRGDLIVLGDVPPIASDRPGLRGREGRLTINGWVSTTRPGGDETAIRNARSAATTLMGRVERAVAADPTVTGTITPPGGTTVTPGGLTEVPYDDQGSAGRQAQIPFTVSWVSHVR